MYPSDCVHLCFDFLSVTMKEPLICFVQYIVGTSANQKLSGLAGAPPSPPPLTPSNAATAADAADVLSSGADSAAPRYRLAQAPQGLLQISPYVGKVLPAEQELASAPSLSSRPPPPTQPPPTQPSLPPLPLPLPLVVKVLSGDGRGEGAGPAAPPSCAQPPY
jgi:hypothetical protein